MPEGGNQFSGTEKEGVLQEEQIGQKVEVAGLQLRSGAAWIGGAKGTCKLIAFVEWPRVKVTKALDDVVAADMVE